MLWNNIKSFQSTQKRHKLTFIFFHPDYTVGFGISPNHAFRLVGYTTGRELHPALKIVIQLRIIIIFDILSVNKKFSLVYTLIYTNKPNFLLLIWYIFPIIRLFICTDKIRIVNSICAKCVGSNHFFKCAFHVLFLLEISDVLRSSQNISGQPW